MHPKALITEIDVQRAIHDGSKVIHVDGDVIITPLAQTTIQDFGVQVIQTNQSAERLATVADARPKEGPANILEASAAPDDGELVISGRNPRFLLTLYETMWRVRAFEQTAGVLFREGRLVGFLHLSIGQEGVAVGACSALAPNDYLTLAHRGHGQMVARGADMKLMMAELLGRSTGYCRGKGGSVHLADFKNGILGANGIIGAGVSIAAGAAMSAKMRETKQVAVSFFGDGTVNHGIFHEALNYAAIHKLPVIYICENNQYAVSMAAADAVASDSISNRGENYNIPSLQVDGQNVLAVYDAVSEAVKRAQNGEGPTFLECITWRFRGHWEGETLELRPQEDRALWEKRDPIDRLERALINQRVASAGDLQAIFDKIVGEIEEAVRFAERSPYPTPEVALQDVLTE